MVARLEPKTPSPVRYVLDAGHSAAEARRAAEEQGISRVFRLSQRDSRLGWIGEQQRPDLTRPRRRTSRLAGGTTDFVTRLRCRCHSRAIGKTSLRRHH